MSRISGQYRSASIRALVSWAIYGSFLSRSSGAPFALFGPPDLLKRGGKPVNVLLIVVEAGGDSRAGRRVQVTDDDAILRESFDDIRRLNTGNGDANESGHALLRR